MKIRNYINKAAIIGIGSIAGLTFGAAALTPQVNTAPVQAVQAEQAEFGVVMCKVKGVVFLVFSQAECDALKKGGKKF